MRTVLRRLGCLILIILFLPLFAIFIGPLLVLAAFRGHQPLGPITLDAVRYGPAGRVGALLLGVAVWILVWSSLVWLAIASSLPAPTVAVTLPETPTPSLPSPTPRPSLTPTVPPPTPTSVPAPTSTPMPPSPTATPTQVPSSPSATSTGTATATPTELFNETLATNTSTPTPSTGPTAEAAEPMTPAASPVPLTATERLSAVAAVEEGNSLLREAIALANEENIQQLEDVWQGVALSVAQDFATELYDRYAKPFDVQFQYIDRPTIRETTASGELVISSRERWLYGGPTTTDEETFEFTYTLSQANGRWLITHYTYRNLPRPTPTLIPRPTATDRP